MEEEEEKEEEDEQKRRGSEEEAEEGCCEKRHASGADHSRSIHLSVCMPRFVSSPFPESFSKFLNPLHAQVMGSFEFTNSLRGRTRSESSTLQVGLDGVDTLR